MAESTLNSASEERAVVFSKCIHVDLEGDVYLALPEKKFLVSSKIVGNASPVLKAMLGPNFAEGKQVSNTDPEDVPLYEDDPEVMGVIFDVIHHRPHSKSLEMTPAFFEKLASACDKYDCATALSSWSSVHLNILMNPPGYIPWVAFHESDKDDDGQVLFSTCMLDDYRGFLQITKRIVYEPIYYHGVTNALGPRPYGLSEQAQGRLPKGLIMSIATKELSIKTDLLEGLEKVIEGLVKKPPRYPSGPFLRGNHPDDPKSHHKYRACECDNTQINLFLKKLVSANLYPLSRLSQTETL